MDFIKETLDWVNRERVARTIGEPLEDLPKGVKQSCAACPIAEALCTTYVYPYETWLDYNTPEHERLEHPEYVTQFIRAFDAGDLPQYDVNAGA